LKVVTFSSIKGGTGKSSLCLLTANHAASAGYRVLVIDMDIQNSATSYYLDDPDTASRRNIAVALQSKLVSQNIVPTNYLGVDLIPSSLDLVDLRAIGERSLSRLLASEALPYDFCFIDTAPTYDNLVLNALHSADLILTPVAFSQFDLKGAVFFQSILARDTEKSPVWRVLFNFYRTPRTDSPEALKNQYEALFRETFDVAIAPVVIPESALVRRSIDTREPITTATAKASLHAAVGSLAGYCGAVRQTGKF